MCVHVKCTVCSLLHRYELKFSVVCVCVLSYVHVNVGGCECDVVCACTCVCMLYTCTLVCGECVHACV